jgi:hypothetical protein
MWLAIGKKTRMKQVAGGRSVEQHCASCGRVTNYVECEVEDKLTAYFVEVVGMTQRRMVCVECERDVALDEAPAPAPSPARAKVMAPAPKPAISEADKDAMLAALKRKMGRAP